MADTTTTCTEGDPKCDLSSSAYFVNSVGRIFTGDFTSLNEDFVIVVLFLVLCLLSWQLIYYLLCKIKAKRPGCPPNGRSQYRNRLRFEAAGAPIRGQIHPIDQRGGGVEEERPTDLRAAGDSWDHEEYDPDYDANNEIMVMLLQENPDDELSEDGGSPGRSENEDDNDVLHRIIMAGSDDEARLLALGHENNDGNPLTNYIRTRSTHRILEGGQPPNPSQSSTDANRPAEAGNTE